MAKTPSRAKHCMHVPANAWTMQTSCELCGRIIEPITPGGDIWRLAFPQPLRSRPVPSSSPVAYAPGDVRLGAMNVALFGSKFETGKNGRY